MFFFIDNLLENRNCNMYFFCQKFLINASLIEMFTKNSCDWSNFKLIVDIKSIDVNCLNEHEHLLHFFVLMIYLAFVFSSSFWKWTILHNVLIKKTCHIDHLIADCDQNIYALFQRSFNNFVETISTINCIMCWNRMTRNEKNLKSY